MECFKLPTNYFPRFSIILNSNAIYYSIEGSTTDDVYFSRIDSGNTNIWAMKMVCPTTGCVGIGGIALYNQTNNRLYTVYGYDKLLFFSLDATLGSLIGSEYVDFGFCAEVFDIILYAASLFMTINWASPRLSVYNSISDTFTEFQPSGTFSFRGIAFLSNLLILGDESSATPKGYLIKTNIEYPNFNTDIVSSSGFVVTSADYLLTNTTVAPLSAVILTALTTGIPILNGTTSYI